MPSTSGGPLQLAEVARWWKAQRPTASVPTKVMALPDAIRSTVRDGHILYLGGSLARPNAAMFELVRQQRGRQPGYTIVAPAVGNQHAVLLHEGLVARVISSLHGNTYPSPGPNPIYAEAERSGRVEFEDWTMLSLVQRLWAGAMGLPAFLSRSVIGTDLERPLVEQSLAARVPSPFGEGAELLALSPLHPDVTMLHCPVADEAGNAVVCPPFYDDVNAAFATSRAVIVTAEEVVPRGVLGEHADLVRVPGALVSAVCEVPFGSHPNQLPAEAYRRDMSYHDDYDFLHEIKEACTDVEQLGAWIQRWVHGVDGHQGYLAQLGEARLRQLKEMTHPDYWEKILRDELPKRWDDAPTRGEVVAVLGARYLAEMIGRDGIRVGLAGVGVSTLATWMASELLEARDYEFDLMAEGGMYGYRPLPGDPYLFNHRNLATNASLSNVETVLGRLVGGRRTTSVGVLGAAQVDRTGAINTSRVGDLMITGSGGGSDIAGSADAVVVTMFHGRRRLVEKVDFVTSLGDRVNAIVTDQAVLERRDGEFELSGVYAEDGVAQDELIHRATASCGWDVPVARDVQVLPLITRRELAMVRSFDPSGHFVA